MASVKQGDTAHAWCSPRTSLARRSCSTPARRATTTRCTPTTCSRRKVAGYPGVFAHGMLTMGMTGRVLTDWFGAEGLLSYGVRFVKQVWPGDALTATATVTSVNDGVAELTVETVNQAGEPVVTGTAKARVD